MRIHVYTYTFCSYLKHSCSTLNFHIYIHAHASCIYTPVYIVHVVLVLTFILTFIRFLLYSYFCLYSHLYELRLYSHHSFVLKLCLHLCSFLIHVMLILSPMLLTCVLCLCSRACSSLNLYYAHAFYSKFIRSHLYASETRGIHLRWSYTIWNTNVLMLPFFTLAILFSKFMHTLIHTQLVQDTRIMRRSI
ncbi:hypothetical protein Hdeb2414_s0002g00051621 [Helianthus debilis subsp. tardiflorus]